MCPAMLEMCTPAPPGAMTLPNSSRTTAVPYRSTASTAAGGACTGETPAVLMTWTTSPRPAAVWARARTDAASDTSTRWVLTVWPASSSAVLAFCRLVSLKSASSRCLPAPVRRAMACPMLPAAMTTWTAGFAGVLLGPSFSSRGGGAGLGGDRVDLVGDGEVALEVLPGEPGVAAAPVVGGQIVDGAEGAGEESVAERGVGHEPDAE